MGDHKVDTDTVNFLISDEGDFDIVDPFDPI